MSQPTMIDPIVEIQFLKDNIILFESNGQLKAEIKNANVQILYTYKYEDKIQEINQKGSTNILLKINFHDHSEKGLFISLDKEDMKSNFSELNLPIKSKISTINNQEYGESYSLLQECFQQQLPQLAEQINKMILKSYTNNISGIKQLDMFEKCKLKEVESNQINFVCTYFIFNQQTNEIIQTQSGNNNLIYPNVKVSSGYTQVYSSQLFEQILNISQKLGQFQRNLGCDQAKYVVQIIDFDKHFPGLSNKVQNSKSLICPLGVSNPIHMKYEGNYYNIKTYNVTASIGQKYELSDSPTEIYGSFESTINVNLQLEVSSQNVLKFKVIKANLEDLKIKDKYFLPKIQSNINMMLSVVNQSLSSKLFRRGVYIGSQYYQTNNPQTFIKNEFCFLEVKDPIF